MANGDPTTTTIDTTDPILNPDTKDSVAALIRGFQIQDPKLFQALMLLNDQLGEVVLKLVPIIRQSLGLASPDQPPPVNAVNFRAVSIGTGVRFDWDEVSDVPLIYEVREGILIFNEDQWATYQSFNLFDTWYDLADPPQVVKWYTETLADDWDKANFMFRTGNLNAIIEPLTQGVHLFMLKSLDSTGAYSADKLSLNFLVAKISSVVITKNIIDNNVLLYWTTPISTFNIQEYRLYKDGALKGTTSATFMAFFELLPGTYTYSIVSVDVAGNLSDPTAISALVNQPPDFALQDTRTSNLTGTRVNVLLTDGPKLLCCWLAETWQHHYVSRSWLQPKNQMDAGYPIYIQPSCPTGSYEEIFDYGATFSNVIVTATWNINNYNPTSAMNILCRMAISNNAVDWSAFTDGSSQYFTSFRYLKLRLEFTGENGKALIELYHLTLSLNVKREMDGGEIYSPLTDVNGTEVFFNKAFKDVESITCSVLSVKEPYMVIYNFVDIPNPVHFFVFVFDTAGNRASKTVEWKARGII